MTISQQLLVVFCCTACVASLAIMWGMHAVATITVAATIIVAVAAQQWSRRSRRRITTSQEPDAVATSELMAMEAGLLRAAQPVSECGRSPDMDVSAAGNRSQHRDHEDTGRAMMNAGIDDERNGPPLAAEAAQVAPELADAAVQCSACEMLEPMFKSGLMQGIAMKKIVGAPLLQCGEITVETLFDRYDPCEKMLQAVSYADKAAVAEQVFGTKVTGIPISGRKPWSIRAIPQRHVEFTVVWSRQPEYRLALLKSVSKLLLSGLPASPFHGESLLQLGARDPVFYTPCINGTMDFIAKLMRHRALPRAFAVDLLKVLVNMPFVGAKTKLSRGATMSRGGPPIGIVSMLRVVSDNLDDQPVVDMPAATRIVVAPIPLRTRGTLLRTQDELQPYAAVSVYKACPKHPGAISCGAAPHIAESDLPEYWRNAAGGEHNPRVLEERACDAEAALVRD